MSLILRHISHQFSEAVVLDDVSLSVEPGEIACLVGPSGCGKTTLLRLAAGLEDLRQGSVELNGVSLADGRASMPPERRPVGFVFQDYVLFPHLTIAENIAFGLAGVTSSKRREIIARELAAVDISELASRYPHQLSGGQQQRAALARALAREPQALLLDEPFASIDNALRRRLRADLRRLLKARRIPAVVVTHDPEEALEIGDLIALMAAGRIVEAAKPEALYATPATPEGAGLFPGSQRLFGTAGGGAIRTPFAEVPYKGALDGPVEIVILAGGAAASAPSKKPLQVVDCRFSGPGWSVTAVGESGARLQLGADAFMAIGSPVGAALDPAKLRIFARA